MNDLIKIAFDMLATLGGLSGLLSVFLFLKQDKRIKNAEAELRESEAQNTIVSDYEKLLDRYEKTLKDTDARHEQISKMHTEKYEFLEKQMKDNKCRLDEYLKSDKELRQSLCYVVNCQLRQQKR